VYGVLDRRARDRLAEQELDAQVDLPDSKACRFRPKDMDHELVDLAELTATVRSDSSDFKPFSGCLLPITSCETL
jgi:hypothetical protein